MAKTTRKELESLLTDINDIIHDLGDLSFTYVLNYAKYEGGYAIQRYTYDKSKILQNDYVTVARRLSAKEMYAYMTGLYNMICETRRKYCLIPHEK